MYKLSQYNIYNSLSDGKYLLVHGYTGAVDIISEDIYNIILSAMVDSKKLILLSKEDFEILRQRGYITDKTYDDERESLKKVAKTVHKVQSKNIAVAIIPTYGCNFRCSYCYEKKLIEKGEEWLNKVISTETVDLIFKSFDKMREEGKNIDSITIYGGEPLLLTNYKIIEYIVKKATQRKIPIKAVTNGFNIDKFIDILSPDKISSLQITIDGLANFHNKRRYLVGGEPSFSKIVDNIDKCLMKKIKVVIRTNIDENNLNEINNLTEFYLDKKWTSNTNFSYYFKGVHSCNKEKEKINDSIIVSRVNSEYAESDTYKYNSTYSVISNLAMNLFKNKGYVSFHAGFCGGTNGMIIADLFGDIYTCMEVVGEPNHIAGKISDRGIIDFNNNYSVWTNRTVNNIEQCTDCKYALFCGGGCPAHAELVNGTLYSPYCDNFINIFNDVLGTTYEGLYMKSKDYYSVKS